MKVLLMPIALKGSSTQSHTLRTPMIGVRIFLCNKGNVMHLEVSLGHYRPIWELFEELVDVGVLKADDSLAKVKKQAPRLKITKDRKNQIKGYLKDPGSMDMDATTAGMLASGWIQRKDGSSLNMISWAEYPAETKV